MKPKRRSEDISIKFVNGFAEGWAFGVGDFFRMQLDIRLEERMDIEANSEKKKQLGRVLTSSEKIARRCWTQGTPPAYSFDRGHIFHELGESENGLRRSIVVTLARPDPGALVETTVTDENGDEIPSVLEAQNESNVDGFVDYEVLSYIKGVCIADEHGYAIKEQSSRSQGGFVELLRTGR